MRTGDEFNRGRGVLEPAAENKANSKHRAELEAMKAENQRLAAELDAIKRAKKDQIRSELLEGQRRVLGNTTSERNAE